MNDNPCPRGSPMAAITAKAANAVTHVYTVVSAAPATTSDSRHRRRSHALLEPRLSLRSDIVRVLPRRPGEVHAPGQVSWLSDRPTPRAFPASRPVTLAGFVPDYSDGVAAASHRLPWALVGTPDARVGAYPNDRGTANGVDDVRDILASRCGNGSAIRTPRTERRSGRVESSSAVASSVDYYALRKKLTPRD